MHTDRQTATERQERQAEKQRQTYVPRQTDRGPRPTSRKRLGDRQAGMHRERERERERQTDRQTDRQTETETERQRQRHRERERERERERGQTDSNTKTGRQRQRQTYRQREGERSAEMISNAELSGFQHPSLSEHRTVHGHAVGVALPAVFTIKAISAHRRITVCPAHPPHPVSHCYCKLLFVSPLPL